MFCNQCEQTAKGTGCTVSGVCGKKPETAALQDLLLNVSKGLSLYAQQARGKGITDRETDRFLCEALFTTLTNVNFDNGRFPAYLEKGLELAAALKEKVKEAGGKTDFEDPAARLELAPELEGMIKQGEELGLPVDREAPEDIRSLQMTMLYGYKGVAAYAYHAMLLGEEDDRVYAYLQEGLASLGDKTLGVQDWVSLVLKCGEANLYAMETLDRANTTKYGQPVPTEVPLGTKKGKCLLVSGHDLKDLEEILEQTRDKGIFVYTHGEMLPAHGYPVLKKYPHFFGHYGTAWQNQKKEFAAFPGAILMTTNCIQKPQDSYQDNIFTAGTVGWPGLRHTAPGDFQPVIDKALELPGFPEDQDKGSVMVGFAHGAVLKVAGKVIDAVKAGQVKHFFLVGGCDGAKAGRSYYTEFIEKAPEDTIILTLACGKYRFFDRKLGDIGGIPRLLDLGQCNDAYSAIKIAAALAEAFDCGVNDLPLSLVLSWYEQKAVAILLTLFHLNIKNIRLGPSLPAFVSPGVLEVLVNNFNIQPVKTAEEDLAELLA